MTNDEEYLLSEALSLLGQFDGLPNLDALEGLRLGLGVKKNDRHIISFTKNPLENSNLLGELFTAASQKQVIELHYHKFSAPEDELVVNLHPYLLKEYNRRWYLFAAAEDDEKLLCFGLDRIDSVIPLPSHKYVEYDGDLNERFEDIIGVTLFEDSPLHKIIFWVSDFSKDYVLTKPIHDSQKKIKQEKVNELREHYPSLKNGVFLQIECRNNYELIRELASFGKDLLVVSPKEIQETVFNRINTMNSEYLKILSNKIMVYRNEHTYGERIVAQHSDYKWGVCDLSGNIIVPFGKYDWIDGFERGLARVKIRHESNAMANNSNKWGIINTDGEEVLPVVYDNIWNFLGKNRFSTRVEKDGEVKNINFHDLNPTLHVINYNKEDVEETDFIIEDDDICEFEYGHTFGKYAGTYAQDVAGFSDEVIDVAFEGDPEVYWNID